MKKTELIKILTTAKLLYGHHELSEPEIIAWFEYFGMHEAKRFETALQAACKSSKYFPSPGEIQEQLNEHLPEVLKITGREALSIPARESELLQDAHEFASRQSYRNPYTQYESLEDLHKAEAIEKAIYRREFIERFERKQEEIKKLILSGMAPREALSQALTSHHKLSEQEAKLLNQLGLKQIQ